MRFVILLAALLLAGPASANILLSHSGRLLDGNDAPQGPVTATFGFFTQKAGGSPIWSESYQLTLTSTGTYAVLLGDTDVAGKKALPESVFASEQVFLEVTIGQTALSPRLIVGAVPVAARAQVAARAELADEATNALKLGGVAAGDYALKADLTGLSTYAKAADVYTKTETYAKTEVYAKGETWAKGEAYGKTETYSKTETDAAIAASTGPIATAVAGKASPADVTTALQPYAKSADTYAKGDTWSKTEADGRYAPKTGAVPAGVTVVATDGDRAGLEAAGFSFAGATAGRLDRIPDAPYETSHNNFAARIGDELYFVGGHASTGSGTACNARTDNYSYNFVKRRWKQRLAMPIARYGQTVGSYANKVWVFGGYDNCVQKAGVPQVHVYDPSTDSWAGKGTMPGNNNHYSACAGIVGNKMYLLGGYDHSLSTGTPQSHSYNFDTGEWKLVADRPSAFPTATHWQWGAAIGTKVFCGGSNQPGYSRQVWAYDTVANSWERKADMPGAMAHVGSAVVNGQVHLVMGHDGTDKNLHWIYVASEDSWTVDQAWPQTGYLPTLGEIPGGFLAVGGWVSSVGGLRAGWQWTDPLVFYRKN